VHFCQIHISSCVIRIFLYCLVTVVINGKQSNLLRSLLCFFLQSLPPHVLGNCSQTASVWTYYKTLSDTTIFIRKTILFFNKLCVLVPFGLSLVFCPQNDRGSFITAQNSNYSCSSALISLQSGKAQSLLDLTPIPI